MKYRLILGYRASYRKWSVKILFPMDEGWDLLPPDIETECQAMSEWCERTGMGRRMAYDEFMFESESDATVFMLKFS